MPRKRLRWASICRSLLFDFANAPSPHEAFASLKDNLELRGFSITDADPNILNNEYDRLRTLLSELSSSDSLFDSEVIDHYTAHYEAVRPPITIRDRHSIGEDLPFSNDGKPFFYDFITYCVIKLLSDERSIQLIHRCENPICNKFFLSKRAKKKGPGGIRFCSDKCRLNFHNKIRIESGEHAAYKRRKRAEGATESYYG